MPTPVKVAAKISEIIEHTPELRSYVMAPERQIPAFLPGQFLHLAIDPYEPGMHWPESRVFSIASSPNDRKRLRITISRQGVYTVRMFDELKVGSRVWLKLPYGSFCPNPDLPGRTVLIAGGSGITPFVSFLGWAVTAKPNAALELHYGAKTAEMLIYRPVIEQCQKDGLTDLTAHYYVEQVAAGALSDSSLIHGRLSTARIWGGLAEPKTCRFYLSGPKAMIDLFRSHLHDLGAAPEAVLSDDWS